MQSELGQAEDQSSGAESEKALSEDSFTKKGGWWSWLRENFDSLEIGPLKLKIRRN
jgi:hypothetical protein